MASFVQSRGTTTSNSLSITDASTISSGALLVLAGYNGAGTAMSALTDSRSNTWTIHQQLSHPSSGRRLYFASCRVLNTYQNGDTITWSGPASTRIFEVIEISGLKRAGTYLDTSSSAASVTNSGSVSSGNITTSEPNTIVVGAAGWTFAATSLDSTTGFTPTTVRVNGNERLVMGYRFPQSIITDDFVANYAAENVGNGVAAVASFFVAALGRNQAQVIA